MLFASTEDRFSRLEAYIQITKMCFLNHIWILIKCMFCEVWKWNVRIVFWSVSDILLYFYFQGRALYFTMIREGNFLDLNPSCHYSHIILFSLSFSEWLTLHGAERSGSVGNVLRLGIEELLVLNPPPEDLQCCVLEQDVLSTALGSAEECLTRDWGAAGSSLNGVTVLCPWERHIYPC